MPTDSRSDLHWLAYGYVSGTLSAEDSEAFERRLDRDQEAREAVARAVELSEVIASLSPDDRVLGSIRRRPPALRRLAYWGAAAACLALAAGLGWSLQRSPRHRGVDSTLALSWSGIRQANEEATEDELTTWLDGEAGSETDLVADAGLPPWLLEAASLRAGDAAPIIETKEN